jgi:23S rRNA A2030 N6-methylase RlmJ
LVSLGSNSLVAIEAISLLKEKDARIKALESHHVALVFPLTHEMVEEKQELRHEVNCLRHKNTILNAKSQIMDERIIDLEIEQSKSTDLSS